MSKSFENKIFGAAKKVFVISSALKELYENKYKTKCAIIPHPIDLTESVEFYDAGRKRGAEFTIVHTGSISSLNKDCIIRLAKAINQIDKYDIRLILTGQEVRQGWIREMGISDEKVSYNFLKEKKEIISLQRNADILFGAVSFNSPFPIESNTALPTKVIEYLTSQRPILIHAPKESFLARYSREKGFGFVVDNPDSTELENAILKLLEDKILANNLIERAKMTKKEHDARKISGLMYQYLGLREQ